MIFRRFAGSLRRQDWTAVVVELLVVVVGVFIGLQVSNWNEDRQTDAKAAVFAQRLRADLREEAWSWEYQIGYFNDVLTNVKRATADLSGTAPLSDEALLIAAYRATQNMSPVRHRATYDELVSAGEISLIRDPALRNLAVHLYTDTLFEEIRDQGNNSPYRKAFRMAIPLDVQLTLAATCGDHLVLPGNYKGIDHSLDYACSTGLSTQAVAASAAALRRDPRIFQLLRLRGADVETNQVTLTFSYKDTRDALQAIAKEKP